jgi:uncharacterized membrane protein
MKKKRGRTSKSKYTKASGSSKGKRRKPARKVKVKRAKKRPAQKISEPDNLTIGKIFYSLGWAFFLAIVLLLLSNVLKWGSKFLTEKLLTVVYVVVVLFFVLLFYMIHSQRRKGKKKSRNKKGRFSKKKQVKKVKKSKRRSLWRWFKRRKAKKVVVQKPVKKAVVKPVAKKRGFFARLFKKGKKEKNGKKEKQIPTVKLKKGAYETEIDALYRQIQNKGKVKLDEIEKKYKISKELAIEWAKILENHQLAMLEYPALGSPRLVKFVEKKLEVENE